MSHLFFDHDVLPLSHEALRGRLGRYDVVDDVVEAAFQSRSMQAHVEDEHSSGHADPWHLSFHASEFPADVDDACIRRLLYRRMNFPAPKGPVPPWVSTTGVLGKAGEIDIVDALDFDGRLLSARPDDPHQTGFLDPEHWMTASTDAVELRPFSRSPHVLEIKGKADEVLEEMRAGTRGPDAAHVPQLMASLHSAHVAHLWPRVLLCGETWKLATKIVGGECREHGGDACLTMVDLEPPTSGSIYYWSRSWPRKTMAFYFELEPALINAGLDFFSLARQCLVEDFLPPRPENFMWNLGPCKLCDLKPICRLDEGVEPRKRKVTLEPVHRLSESRGVEITREVRPSYDPWATRKAIFEFWGATDPLNRPEGAAA